MYSQIVWKPLFLAQSIPTLPCYSNGKEELCVRERKKKRKKKKKKKSNEDEPVSTDTPLDLSPLSLSSNLQFMEVR